MIEVNIEEAKELMKDIFRKKYVPYLLSSPGLGKSYVIREIANEYILRLYTVMLSNHDPVDISGYPVVNNGVATFIPFDIFPLDGKKSLLFLDEFTSVPPQMQALAYRIALEKVVGTVSLPPNVAIAMAGNLDTDQAIVYPMSSAMQRRVVTIFIKPDMDCTQRFGSKNNWDHRVLSFLLFRPQLLHKMEENQKYSFPCPATWETTSNLIKDLPTAIPHNKLPLLTGTIGEGAGLDFYNYSKIYTRLPTLEDLVNGSYGQFDNNPGLQYALIGFINSNINDSNCNALMKVVNTLTKDYQIIFMKTLMSKPNNMALRKNASIQSWYQDNASAILG